MANVNPFTSVPLPSTEQPLRLQATSLNGTPFKIRFDWNSRTERWSFSLFTNNETPLLVGGHLSAGIDLFRTISDDLRPTGELRLVDIDEPTLDTIGTASLIYLDGDFL